MRIRPLLGLGVLAVLAAGCARRSVIASQPEGPLRCGSPLGWALFLNGRVLWTTDSETEMREWLSHIDSADVQTMQERHGPEAAAIYGVRGANGAVEVTLKRGSASERRFSVPPRPPAIACYRPLRPVPPAPASAPTH